jgi:hypothetical protein
MSQVIVAVSVTADPVGAVVALVVRPDRISNSLSQPDRIGFSGSYLSDVERGIKVASLPLAEALDKVFGAPGTFVRLRSVALTRDYEEEQL